MKTLFILFALFTLVSCDKKPGHHESSFKPVTTNETTYFDIDGDGILDKVVLILDSVHSPVSVEIYSMDSGSAFTLYHPKLKLDNITIDDFLSAGINGLDENGSPEMYLYAEDSLISYSEWINEKKEVHH